MRLSLTAWATLAVVLLHPADVAAQVQGQWTNTGTLQSPREEGAEVTLAKGGALAIGGVDNNGNVLASAEIYNGKAGTWALTGSLQTAREAFAAVVLKTGKVLVAGGVGTGSTVLNGAELFDPKTSAWTPAGALSVARFGHTATLLPDGKVLVAGGCTAIGCGTLTAVSEIYDPATNGWAPTGSMNTARAYHTAVQLGSGKVLAIDGDASGVTATCELYDPATGTWSTAPSTNVARSQHGTTLLADGKVLVTGGVIAKYPMNSAEIYDPASNAWTLTGNMATARYAHTSTLLGDGTVVVAGGEGQSISCGKDCTGFIPTASAEIYNETTGSFGAAASLPRALAYQSTTLLTTGRALTSGGVGYNAYCCQVVNNSEYYTPLTLTLSPSSLNFGYLQVGLTSGSQMVTVTNVSAHAASFTGIAASGDYVQNNNCPSTLQSGQGCTINVNFKPAASGTRNGAVTLKDNAPGSPTQTVALTGVGETLALGFAPASIDFGGVTVGSSSTQSAVLINDGAAPVNVTSVAIVPSHNIYTQTNDCPATLAVQQSCTFQITFRPPDVFTYKATLSVANDAGAPATLALKGLGLDGPGVK